MACSNIPKLLIEQVASFDNLFAAFHECARGKKSKSGYQEFLINYGETLYLISQEIEQTANFCWSPYRHFYVYEPKKRLIMAAPFRDRVVHTAIHRVLAPFIDPLMSGSSYACRPGMGNRHAVLRLYQQLQLMQKQRYTVKLDIQQYFASIPHTLLLECLLTPLPDHSLRPLLTSLLASHQSQPHTGIPIGNLTSQLFANFYLNPLDRHACQRLDYDPLMRPFSPRSCYLRYMDDMVITAKDKALTLQTAQELVALADGQLLLQIPSNKFMVLAQDPIPFLGFVLEAESYRPLRRNQRRFQKKIQRSHQSLSQIALMEQSYQAWAQLT